MGTKGTGMEEIISHGYNGYLFDADSLSSLEFYLDLVLKDDPDYKRLCKNAQFTFDNKFNPKKYKLKLIELLNKETKNLI